MDTLLVIGSGSQSYREYALKALAEKYAIVLLHTSPLSWQKPYVIDTAQVVLSDKDSVLDAARQMAKKYMLAGVFTYDEPSLEIAAIVAQDLHVLHNKREAILASRDKSLMRQRWQHYGVPSARSCLSFSLEEAREAALTIGFPVVVKPRSMAASIGVMQVQNLEELTRAFAVAKSPHPMFQSVLPGVLVEEYLDGPEISVESVLYDGVVHIVAITHKQTGLAPYFEEIGHMVSPDEPPDAYPAICETVVAAHQALGITMGVTHAEVRLTSSGPRMIEINARVAGDFIPQIVSLACGIDLTVAGANCASGTVPSLQPQFAKAAAIHFIYPDQGVRIHALEIGAGVSRLPQIHRVEWLTKPGDEVRLPPQNYVARLGFVIATGQSMQECKNAITSALDLLHINTTPLDRD